MAGRCEGCGETGSPAKVSAHILECAAWQALYAQDPALALSPADSYQRWQDSGKAGERTARIGAAMALENRLQAAAVARFAKPPDILED